MISAEIRSHDESRPLLGRVVAITRPLSQTHDMLQQVEVFGGRARLYPLIATQPVTDDLQVRNRLQGDYDAVIFTSANGVRAYASLQQDEVSRSDRFVFCVGERTAQAAKEAGLRVCAIPASFSAEDLLSVIARRLKRGARILWTHGNLADDKMQAVLSDMGYEAVTVTIYQTVTEVANAQSLVQDVIKSEIDVLTFASGSAVDALFDTAANLNQDLIAVVNSVKKPLFAVIGPKTQAVLKRRGIDAQVVSQKADGVALIDSIAALFAKIIR